MSVKVTTHENLYGDIAMRTIILRVLENTEAINFIDGDGHSIYEAEVLEKAGFPNILLEPITYVHKSDTRSIKSTIFDKDGNVIPELKGVAALELHYAVANALLLVAGADYNDTLLGRGFQARELAEAIKREVNNVNQQA